MEKDIFIALGSNAGNRELNLLRAVAEIARIPAARVTALSPFYETEPVGMEGAASFFNAVLRLESSLSVDDMLRELLRIESETFQRQRNGTVAPRRMDLDLLFYGEALIDRPPELVVPHPRLHLRRFVLQPLADIAPGFMHPRLQKTVATLLAGLADSSAVIKT